MLCSWKKYLVAFLEISYRRHQDHAIAYPFPDTLCVSPHFSTMQTTPVLQLSDIYHRVFLSTSPNQDPSSLVSPSQGTNASMHAHTPPAHFVKCLSTIYVVWQKHSLPHSTEPEENHPQPEENQLMFACPVEHLFHLSFLQTSFSKTLAYLLISHMI